jgi:hypothetical protein
MTHTPHPSAGAPGDNPMIDAVPGYPPVPHTVWRTPAGDDQAPITARLAYRLLAAYSEPGDVVVDLTGSPHIQALAAAGDRTHVRAVFTDAGAIAVVATTTPPPDAPRGAARRGAGEPAGLADWFGDDLRHPDRPAGTLPDIPAPRPMQRQRPSLLVALWPLHLDEPVNARRLASLMAAASAVLHSGGCVAIVAAEDSGGQYTPLVAAAHAAGLRYLQHIVAVRADVHADEFVYPSAGIDITTLTKGAHLSVHDDIVVFATQGGDADD